MELIWDKIVKSAAIAGGFIVGLFGGWNGAMTLLAIMMIADYVTGCVCAFMGNSPKTESGHWLSTSAFMGLLKKGAVLLIVLIATRLDMAIGDGASRTFQQMATYYYIATEGLSVLENVGLMGVPVPKALKKYFEVMREDSDGEEDE